MFGFKPLYRIKAKQVYIQLVTELDNDISVSVNHK